GGQLPFVSFPSEARTECAHFQVAGGQRDGKRRNARFNTHFDSCAVPRVYLKELNKCRCLFSLFEISLLSRLSTLCSVSNPNRTVCFASQVKVLTKMSSKVPSSNNIAHARRAVQQLRIEANIERIKVSKASADLMHYCGEHAKYDPLLMGIPASENPFKDKKPCTIL
uniref:Guanine nucleotide-binding protein subunit gamma n=2 Tax=Scleropages formosus TaxID=113540 RepID=A0A8C9VR85_SCLFO